MALKNFERQKDRAGPLECRNRGLKTLRGPGASLCRFDLAITRRSVGHERVEKIVCDLCHLLYSSVECLFVCLRWLREATEFANKLQRRRTNLFFSRRRFEVMKGLNISTHAVSLPP